MRTVPSVVLASAAIAAAAASGPVMPIARARKPTLKDLEVAPLKFKKSAKTGTAPLINGGLGNYFFSNMTVADNPIPQAVTFDTGSSDTWFIGSTCYSDSISAAEGGCYPNMPGSVTVDKTFIKTGLEANTAYGDGSYGVNYTIYNATVAWGTLKAKNLPIGIATYEYGGLNAIGTLGMGWNDISDIAVELDVASGITDTGVTGKNPEHNANFLDALGYTLFGVFISPDTNMIGQVSFGFLDPTKYNASCDLQWFPVTNFRDSEGNVYKKGWWQFNFTALEISYSPSKGKSHKISYFDYWPQTSQTISIADSGTPQLVLSNAASNIINTWFNSSYNANDNIIPCPSKKFNTPLVLTMSNGKTTSAYEIPFSVLSAGDGVANGVDGTCGSLVSGGADDGFTIFGAPFFQAAYSGFDKKQGGRVGFSPIISNWKW
ncbi:hypothetical protein HDU83_000200 [Entophlyctis luteolus]|nr:hypothetical protein HDU83_000200 [Entophlyctis luteolus]KAJ3389781.1 hypothetical protein HDU84_008272 [Entophlyctis sp. JEL0112]